MILTWSVLICIMHKIGNCPTACPLHVPDVTKYAPFTDMV